jgi:hypothetical protein
VRRAEQFESPPLVIIHLGNALAHRVGFVGLDHLVVIVVDLPVV